MLLKKKKTHKSFGHQNDCCFRSQVKATDTQIPSFNNWPHLHDKNKQKLK